MQKKRVFFLLSFKYPKATENNLYNPQIVIAILSTI